MNYPRDMRVVVLSYFACVVLGGAYMGVTAASLVSLKGLYLGVQWISIFMTIQHAFGMLQPLVLKLKPSLTGMILSLNCLSAVMALLVILFGFGVLSPKIFLILYIGLKILSSPLGVAASNLEDKLFSEAGVDLQWFKTYAQTLVSGSMMVSSVIASIMASFLNAKWILLAASPLFILMIAASIPSLTEFHRRRW